MFGVITIGMVSDGLEMKLFYWFSIKSKLFTTVNSTKKKWNCVDLQLSFNFNLSPGNGYIEGTELDGFLREFVASANATDVSPEVRTEMG